MKTDWVTAVLLSLLVAGCSPSERPPPPVPPPAPNRTYRGSLITDKAPYEWRDGAKLHFFRGKYWLLGGWTVGPRKAWDGDITTDEIWSSPDLATWTLERKHVHMVTEDDFRRFQEGPDARWTPDDKS